MAEPVLLYVLAATLLHVLDDLRNRQDPAYLTWFHHEFMPDVKQRGVTVPLIGYREGEQIRVLDGMTRLLAALMAGGEKCEKIPILVYPTKPSEAGMKLAQLLVNTHRRDLSPLEYAAVYFDLMRLLDISAAELARRIHTNPSHIAKCIAISKWLTAEVQALVIAGKIAPRAAYKLSLVRDHQKQIEIAKRATDPAKPVAVETIEEWVDKELGGKKPKKDKSWTITIQNASMTIKGDDRQGVVEALIAKLKEILKRLRDGENPNPAPA